jgi:hypothetical protein
MDSDLINISLNQGKQFKNYQKKIKKSIEESLEKSKRVYKKREGFEMPSQSTTMQSQIQMQMPMDYDGTSDNLIQKRDNRAASIAKVNKAEQQQLTNLQTQYK